MLAKLIASFGSIEAQGSGPLTRVPEELLDGALNSFLRAASLINGLWKAESLNPVAIPPRPEKKYYRRLALDFARSYFFKNLLKCLLTTQILRHHLEKGAHFWDLGAGSGAFTIALLMSRIASHVDLVDYSASQLDLADKVLRKLGCKSAASVSRLNLGNFKSLGRHCAASYALGETMQNDIDVVRLIEDSKTFTLIDTPLVVRGIQSYLTFNKEDVFSRYVEFSVDSELEGLIEGGGGRFCLLFKHAFANRPWAD